MYESKAEPKKVSKVGRPPGFYGSYSKVRIGADIEFELHQNGRFFPAHKVLSGLHSPLGTDGNTTTGELRPCLKTGGTGNSLYYYVRDDPTAPDSQGLSSLLDQLALKLDVTFTVHAGSGCHKPLGGHIHFSSVAVDAVFLAVLDQFIAIPLNQVSNTQLRIQRHHYGRLSAVDVHKPHGGFEYRAPLSWISTPDIARGVISTAWLLAQGQRHGSLLQFKTWDDFFSYPRKGHARNIKSFTTVLAELRQRNIKLEEIDVLDKWGKKDLLMPINKADRKPRQKLIPVEWEWGDSRIQEIEELAGELFSPLALRIVGANHNRSSKNVVYLPRGYRVTPPPNTEIAFTQWERPWIGLSWSLRQDVELAALVVRAVVASARRTR